MKNLPNILSKSWLHLKTENVNSTLFGTLQKLDDSFKLKIV